MTTALLPSFDAKTLRSWSTWRVPAILTAIIVLGLIVRLLLAPAEGNGFDVGVNQGWAKSAVQLGLARSYSEQVDGNMLPNYPPFSMLIFAGAGHLYKAFISPDYDRSLLAYRIVIKLPAMLADLATAIVFFFLLRRWKGTNVGLLGSALYTFHPAVLYDSAIWGQTDSIFTFFLTIGFACYAWGLMALAGGLAMLAVLTKMQAIMVGPLFLLLFLRSGWKGFLRACLAAVLVTILVLAPFAIGQNLQGVWNVYATSVGFYPIVSSAAYNLWWALMTDSAGTTNDTTLLFGVITFKHAGLLLVGIFYAATLWILRRHLRVKETYARMMPAMMLAASVAAYIFFMFNTQMHERYLFPFVAFGLPLVFWNRRAALLYAAVCTLYLINLMGWLPYSAIDRALFATFPTFDGFIASLQLVTFFCWFGLTWRLALEAPKAKRTLWKTAKERLRAGYDAMMAHKAA